MIYTNGFMRLICLQGENERIAYFLCLNDNQLIKASGVIWEGDGNIYWNDGLYRGHIMQNIKDDEND